MATGNSAKSSDDVEGRYDEARGKSAAVAAVATTATLHRDDDADGGNNSDDDAIVPLSAAVAMAAAMLYRDDDDTRICFEELALKLGRPIDEGDRRLILRDSAIDNAMTIARTMNGDNHFARKRQRTSRCIANGYNAKE